MNKKISTNDEPNIVKITNDKSKYYSDLAQDSASTSANYAVLAQNYAQTALAAYQESQSDWDEEDIEASSYIHNKPNVVYTAGENISIEDNVITSTMNIIVDDETIEKDSDDIISTIGVKSKTGEVLYDWIGTKAEYDEALDDELIDSSWICWIKDNVDASIRINDEIVANKNTLSLPLFYNFFSPYEIQEDSFLEADSFSWQDGEVYTNAYESLVEAYNDESSTEETYTRDENTVTYKLTSQGWKIALPSQEANIISQWANTAPRSSADYFILDTDNTQFKLPRFTDLQGRGSYTGDYGSIVEAGLPNITGSDNGISSASTGYISSSGVSGAFYDANAQAYGGLRSDGYSVKNKLLGFDASLSNPIYGNSDTVQQQSNLGYLYFYLGGNVVSSISTIDLTKVGQEQINLIESTGEEVKEELEEIATQGGFASVTLGNLTSDGEAKFDAKADVDLRNVSVLIETIADEFESGTEKYIIYKRTQADGSAKYWCEQYGMNASSSASNEVISLLVEYLDTDYSIVLGNKDATGTTATAVIVENTITTASFTIDPQIASRYTYWETSGYCNEPTTEVN